MAKKMISLEISDDLREALRKKAFIEGISVSEAIRRLLVRGINEYENERYDER